jgi:hypothetical protein
VAKGEDPATTFVFEKLKMDVVISESGLLKNGSGNYPNPFLQIQIQMWY